MTRIVIAYFATKLHGESYYNNLYEIFKKHVSKTGIVVEATQPITSVEEARSLGEKYREYFPVLISLTGGTSKLMYEFAKATGSPRVLLIGHGDHNSLPSTISARSRLDSDGVYTWIEHCKRPESPECGSIVEKTLIIAKTVSSLLGSKILLIAEREEKPDEAEELEALLGGVVDVVSMDTIASKLGEADTALIESFYKSLEIYEFTIPKDSLEYVARFYAIVKSMAVNNGYKGIAVDCFPYLVKYRVTPCLALAVLNAEGVVVACEGDLGSLLLMMIYKELTGLTGWIANASVFRGNKIYFSHCTIATNMILSGKIVTHFESGYPYALSGRLVPSTYTLASISRDYSIIMGGLGKITTSGLLYNTMCRTQAIVELDYDVEELPLYLPANHHVLVPGDIRRELKAVAWLLGIDYVDYSKVVGSKK